MPNLTVGTFRDFANHLIKHNSNQIAKEIWTSNEVGEKIKIYSGLTFLPLVVNKFMVGFKFGEFAFTRKRLSHEKKKKAKNKK